MKRTLALALCLTAAMTFSTMQMHAAKKSKSPITIGCIVSGTGDVDATFRNLQEMGFTSCQSAQMTPLSCRARSFASS